MKDEYFKIIPVPRDVFLIFVTLNVMGYNDENNPKGMSSIRTATRKNIIPSKNWKIGYPKLYRTIKTNHPWYLLNKILDHKETRSKNDFLKELRAFSKESLAQESWKTFQLYEKGELAKINNSSMKNEMCNFLSYIGKTKEKINKIKIIFNPLDAYWRGYNIKIGDDGYIIAGPGMEKNNYELIRHELLHLFSYPFRIPAYMTSIGKHKKLESSGYANSKIIRNEYIIRSLNLLYEKNVLKKDIRLEIDKESKNFPYLNEVIDIIK